MTEKLKRTVRASLRLAPLALLLPMAVPAFGQRQQRDLATGWKFQKQDGAPDADTSTWETVSVPHTWNAQDGQNGKAADPQYKSGYYRGPAWYEHPLDVPAAWKGKRVFLRFEGASLVSDVYLNGALLGQHRGAFGAFCFELTPKLHFDGKDELRVRVDNARVEDVAPLSGDFTVFGGIYRPVHLFATDPVCVSPLDFASPGVYLSTKTLTQKEAGVQVKTQLSNGLGTATRVRVETQIKDASGKVVARGSDDVALAASANQEFVQNLRVRSPHLWQGRRDPYLYSATVQIRRGRTLLDEVVQPLGLRTVAISNERGFLLNGVPYPIYGVNRHQERQDKGWALSNADHDQDHQLIYDMGTTAIRLAHYPQSDYFQALCDRSGILLWQEIPQVNETRETPEFIANAQMQMREMVLQHYNHPSVAFWGVSNELGGTSRNAAAPDLEKLKQIANELDGSRIVVLAHTGDLESKTLYVPDWIGYNQYPGWYGGRVDNMTSTINSMANKLGKRFAMSEYGAGANPLQHMEGAVGELKINAGGPFHPEEYQTYVHQRDWQQMKNNPKLWGTFIWAMFDFAVDGRNEGSTPGLNDKGMVSHDRKTKKDAYFFYKANWNTEPMVYIAARRMTARQLATTQIKVFSSCASVELKINGRSLGAAKADDVHVFRWENVVLQPGTNRIEAIAQSGGKQLQDECEWVLEAATP